MVKNNFKHRKNRRLGLDNVWKTRPSSQPTVSLNVGYPALRLSIFTFASFIEKEKYNPRQSINNKTF